MRNNKVTTSKSEMDQDNEASRYYETLKDLTINSRPHIVNLTELARDSKIPETIVNIIAKRIESERTPPKAKMPCLYLVDSIIKNHKDPYLPLFTKKIVMIFSQVFEIMDEAGRKSLFKLRNTWTPWFSNGALHALDTRVKKIDPAWPVVPLQAKKPNIHVNPAVFGNTPEASNNDDELKKMETELRELKKKEMELKIAAAKKAIAEASAGIGLGSASSEILVPKGSGSQQQEKVCNFMVMVS